MLGSIDTEQKAYIVGWLYSRAKIRVQVTEPKLPALELIRDFFNLGNINRYGSIYEYNINNKTITDELLQCGCGINKHSIVTFPPRIKEDLLWHFIRGVFDSYGTIIFNKQKYINITITYRDQFLEELRVFLRQYNIQTIYYYKSMHTNTTQLIITKRDSCLKFLENIYFDANYYLARNFDKYKSDSSKGV